MAARGVREIWDCSSQALGGEQQVRPVRSSPARAALPAPIPPYGSVTDTFGHAPDSSATIGSHVGPGAPYAPRSEASRSVGLSDAAFAARHADTLSRVRGETMAAVDTLTTRVNEIQRHVEAARQRDQVGASDGDPPQPCAEAAHLHRHAGHTAQAESARAFRELRTRVEGVLHDVPGVAGGLPAPPPPTPPHARPTPPRAPPPHHHTTTTTRAARSAAAMVSNVCVREFEVRSLLADHRAAIHNLPTPAHSPTPASHFQRLRQTHDAVSEKQRAIEGQMGAPSGQTHPILHPVHSDHPRATFACRGAG